MHVQKPNKNIITSILPRARREKQRNARGLACWLILESLREHDESPQVNEKRETTTLRMPPTSQESTKKGRTSKTEYEVDA